MSRFPPLSPPEQTPEQAKSYASLTTLTADLYGKNNFSLKNSSGAFVGPFAPLLYTPSIAPTWITAAHAVISNPELTLREREMAILAALSFNRAEFGLYAHTRVAGDAGFDLGQVRDAGEGRCPKGLSEREEMCYNLTLELVRLRGPLGNESYQKALGVLGRESLLVVIHLAGSYLYTGLLLNATKVPIPEGAKLFPDDK